MISALCLILLSHDPRHAVELPRLEKVWRTDAGGSTQKLFFTSSGELLFNTRFIKWNGKEYVSEYDRLQSLCTAGKIEQLTSFPDKTRGLAYCPDGKRCVIVKGYRGHDLELWDLAAGKPLVSTKFGMFKASFAHLAMNLHGTELLLSHDGQVELWDVARLTRTMAFESPKHDLLRQLHITPEGQLLGVFARNYNYTEQSGEIVVWDFRAQQAIRTIPLQDSLLHFGLTDNSKYVVAGSDQGVIKIWEMGCTEANPKYTLQGHSKGYARVIMNATGNLIATASLDNSVMLWDATTQQAVARNTFPRNGLGMDIAFAPDGKHLYVTGNVQKPTPDGKTTWSGFVTMFKLPGE